jgi:hypothetical protein
MEGLAENSTSMLFCVRLELGNLSDRVPLDSLL